MASLKMIRSSNSRSSDLSHRIISSSSIRPHQFKRDLINGGYGCYSTNTMTVEGILQKTFTSDLPATESSSLLDTSIMDTSTPTPMDTDIADRDDGGGGGRKSVDEVWREIVTGGEEKGMMKEETQEDIMTLEEFLAKSATTATEKLDVKIPPPPPPPKYGFEHPPHTQFQMIDKVEGSLVAFGNGLDVYGGGARGGKRGRVIVESLDKVASKRQRRMIKNRESAARSRERKQAYQVELESLATKLEEDYQLLSKEIEQMRKERFKKLMEFIIPVLEKELKPQLCVGFGLWNGDKKV